MAAGNGWLHEELYNDYLKNLQEWADRAPSEPNQPYPGAAIWPSGAVPQADYRQMQPVIPSRIDRLEVECERLRSDLVVARIQCDELRKQMAALQDRLSALEPAPAEAPGFPSRALCAHRPRFGLVVEP